MKLLKILLFTFLFVNVSYAENVVSSKIRTIDAREFVTYSLFTASNVDVTNIKTEVSEYELFDVDHDQLTRLITNDPSFIRLTIGNVQLVLYKFVVTTDEFQITTSEGRIVSSDPILHYRGIIENDYNSLVSISISKREICGFYSNNTSNNVIGKLLNHTQYIVYDDKKLLLPRTFNCQTIPVNPIKHESSNDLTEASPLPTGKCIKFYLEVNYAVYTARGSDINNVTNFIQGAFAQVATLYANDGMSISINQLFIWTTPDPYTGNFAYDRLIKFGLYRTSFNGDLAHLIGYHGGGGIAYLDVLCGRDENKIGYSDVGFSYSIVPTYSWTVEVLAHEMGHNVGTPHTHDCVWNGNNTAIDGCGPAQGYSGGSCPTAPIPTNGGTIMSYCHLISGVGINFNNGFGLQPSNLMKTRIANASCLQSNCDTVTPPPPPPVPSDPTNLNAVAVSYNSINLTWTDNAYNEIGYRIEYKTGIGSYSLLATVSTNITSYIHTNALANTSYTYRIYAYNSGGNSGFSNESSVITPTNGCTAPPATPGTISGPSGVCRYQQNVLYTIQPVTNAVNYTWTVPPGSKIVVNGVISTGTTLTTTATTIGVNYGNKKGKITVKAINACGSSATRNLNINFVCRNSFNLFIDNITLYPNPTSSYLTLNFTSDISDDYNITIFDNVGKVVYQQIKNYMEGNVTDSFDLSKLENGNYIFQLQNVNDVFTKRFIILK